jgi:hypothetical protein
MSRETTLIEWRSPPLPLDSKSMDPTASITIMVTHWKTTEEDTLGRS